MSIRELTCPAHGHPVGPDDAYCGVCGAAVYIPPVGARQTWPRLVPEPESLPAAITPIRPEVEFKPLDFAQGQSSARRRPVVLGVAALATIGCVALLVTSELMLGDGTNEAFWVVMWLFWYATTVVVTAGWFFVLIQWARKRS
ncbi:MAG: hypothetical protein WKF63_06945 [Thermomicrobiales bacterium]